MSGDLIKSSRAEQGGDRFPGIDEPRLKTLPQGTILIKFEPSQSGFFVSEQPVNQLDGNSKELAKAFQIAPRAQTIDGRLVYDYRERASVFVTSREIEVAASRALANPQYGPGGPEQIHIADYQVDRPAHNLSLGLQKVDEVSLTDFKLDKAGGEKLEAQNRLHIQTRNYFCYLSQAEELARLRPLITNPQSVKKCDSIIREIKQEASNLRKSIAYELNNLKNQYPDLKNVAFPSYQEKITHLEKTMASPALSRPLSESQLDRDCTGLRRHLLDKVQDSIAKVVSGKWSMEKCDQEIKIDDLRKGYEADQFALRAQCDHRLALNGRRVRELEYQIGRIDNREKELLRMGKFMHTLQDKAPLAKEADSRLFFKKSFLDRHHHDLRAYFDARSELGQHGIHTPQDLSRQEQHFFKNDAPSREALRAELGTVKAEGQELRTQAHALSRQLGEYQQFLSMRSAQPSLDGSRLSMG